MPVNMVWCDSSFWPHSYGFCPNEHAWKGIARVAKRDLGPYPPLSMKATTTLWQNYRTKTRVAVVTVRKGFAPQVVADLLVHEAMHVWRDIREAIGEEHPSSEFEAYMVQHIVAELFAAYQRTRGRLFIRP
jgi:hypothetical protein